MNTDLVERLRKLSERQELKPDVSTVLDAAAAIEELQAEVKRLKMRCADCEYGNSPWPEEPVHEPKLGEWIVDGMYTYNLMELNGKAYEPVYRCSCCNRQMESYLRLDEPKMPEDADFPEYCPHCGAKMEVQDIKSVTMREGDTDADGFFRKAFEAVMEAQE